MIKDRKKFRLYAITDRRFCRGAALVRQVEQAILGGATIVQLREKKMPDEAFLAEARKVKAVCDRYHVPLIINDNVEIAVAADAAGVHLGQDDMGVEEAREKLGPDKIIGVSARTVEQALLAERQGADYLGSGAVFGTSTKEDASRLPIPVFADICRSVSIPVIAIGGVEDWKMRQLKGTGLSGVAVVSALFGSGDIRREAEKLRCLSDQLVASKEGIEGIVFDMDGVLLDSMPVWETISSGYLRSIGIEPAGDCNSFVRTKTMEGGAEYLKNTYQIEKTVPEIVQGIVDIIFHHYRDEIPAKPGVLNFLEEMKEAQIPAVVATSGDRGLAQAAFARTGIAPYLKGMVTCAEAGAGKAESPAVYDQARELFGKDRGRVLVVEDSLHGIETAKAAGYLTAGIYDPASEQEQISIRQTADIYFHRFSELDIHILRGGV